ncbi:MAG: glycosyl transferase [Acidimicrobiaceae bacterium]|nr:glycosyl transferase [Acidimicrobiaceae bacterium]
MPRLLHDALELLLAAGPGHSKLTVNLSKLPVMDEQHRRASGTRIDIAVPVYNEERDLEPSVRRLRAYLDESIPFDSVVTIVDNASTDDSYAVATELARTVPGVRVIHLEEKGRGRALRAAWSVSTADVVAYMDVDLSTDLNALLPLLGAVVSGHSDVAIGSRLVRGARVVRGPKRELISRSYNVLLRLALGNRFSDAQCGFKALRADEARALLPAVVDDEWFFDTELLVLAERNGLRIHEVPVDWRDDPDSRVHIARTALGDLRGVCRLLGELARGKWRVDDLPRNAEELSEVTRFAGVGVISTIFYLVICGALATRINLYLANLVALLVCSIGNAIAHARFTFSGYGPFSLRRSAGAVALAWCTSVALTTAALAAAEAFRPRSGVAVLAALLAGTGAAALVRFALFKALTFRSHVRRLSRDQPAAPSSLAA